MVAAVVKSDSDSWCSTENIGLWGRTRMRDWLVASPDRASQAAVRRAGEAAIKDAPKSGAAGDGDGTGLKAWVAGDI
jgi:hypothetical protein